MSFIKSRVSVGGGGVVHGATRAEAHVAYYNPYVQAVMYVHLTYLMYKKMQVWYPKNTPYKEYAPRLP